MGIASGLAVYFIIWFTVLFMVLPWGVRTDASTGQVGAPQHPHMKRKAIIITILSALIWLGINYAVNQPHLLSFRDIARGMPQ